MALKSHWVYFPGYSPKEALTRKTADEAAQTAAGARRHAKNMAAKANAARANQWEDGNHFRDEEVP